MPEAMIIYFGQLAKVNCDGNCQKAWGINNRPQVTLSNDEDDTAYLSDNELGMAPSDPGTYEGDVAKPLNALAFPSKWCVRECERCNMSAPGQYKLPLPIKDFRERRYNMAWRERLQKLKPTPPPVAPP